MDDESLTSSSTECLECSEDMAVEIMDDLDDSSQESAIFEAYHTQWADKAILTLTPVDLEFATLVRTDLETQAELYDGSVRTPCVGASPGTAVAASNRQAAGRTVQPPSSISLGAPPYPGGFGPHNINSAFYPPASVVGAPCAHPPLMATAHYPGSLMHPQAPQQYSHAPYSSYCTPLPSQPASLHRFLSGWTERGLSDRRLLVGWMLELVRAAQLQKETLFCASSLLDRFLAAGARTQEQYPQERVLQLLALACVSVAMKFEEVVPLHSSDLLALAVDPATGKPLFEMADLSEMEWTLLRAVDWRVRAPNALTFLQNFIHCLLRDPRRYCPQLSPYTVPHSLIDSPSSCCTLPSRSGCRTGCGCSDGGSGDGDGTVERAVATLIAAAAVPGPVGTAAGPGPAAAAAAATLSGGTVGGRAGAAAILGPAASTSVTGKAGLSVAGEPRHQRLGAGPAATAAGAAASPRVQRLWEAEMTSWAYSLLDLALVHHGELIFSHSTLAMACLVLAERAAANAVAFAEATAETTSSATRAGGRVAYAGHSNASIAAVACRPAAYFAGPLAARASYCQVDLGQQSWWCWSPSATYNSASAATGFGSGFLGGYCYDAVERAACLPLAVVAPDVCTCVPSLERLWLQERPEGRP